MINIILNILNKKQNLSYPFVFEKIAFYYYNKNKFKIDHLQKACRYGKFNLIKFFIEKIDFSNIKIYDSFFTQKHITPIPQDFVLFWISYYGNFEITEYLIKKGVHQHVKNYALENAAFFGNLKIFKYLIDNGAEIYNSKRILSRACYNGHFNIVKYLVEEKDNKLFLENEWILCYTIYHNHFDIVKYFVEKGADIHGQAIYFAYETENTDIFKYLIEKGVKFDSKKALTFFVKL